MQERTEELASINEELRVTNEELHHEVDHRVHAEKEARDGAERAAILNSIIHVMNEATDLSTLYERALTTTLEQLGFDSGIVVTKTDTGNLDVEYAHNLRQAFIDAVTQMHVDSTPYLQAIYERGEVLVRDHPPPDSEGYRLGLRGAEVSIPFASEGVVIGHAALHAAAPRSFTQAEQTLFQAIGFEFGTAVARLKAKLNAEEHARRQSTLTNVISAGNQAPDVHTACTIMLEAAMDFMDVSHGSIYLLNEADSMIERQYARGYSQTVLDASDRFPITTSFYLQIYAGKAMFLNDYQKQGTENLRELAPELNVVAAVPLVAELRVIGNYMVGSTRTAPFTAQEETLLIAIGQAAGTVIARLQAEEALKEGETRYRRLVERSFDAVFIHSDGVVRFANEVAARTLKATSPDELIGMKVLDLPTPRDRARVKERVALVYETGESTPLAEMQLEASDGTTVDVEISATHITYEGKPAVYAVFRDIGERKQMEAQLKQYADHLEDLVEERTAQLTRSEEEFRTLFDESSIAQIRYNAEGLPIRMNKAAAELFGVRDISDIRGRNMFSSIQAPQEDMDRLRKGYPLRFEQVYDFRAIRDGGLYTTTRSDVGHFDLYVLPLTGAAGTSTEGYLAQIVDLNDLREAERALKNAERLTGIGETAAMIGHDLRNPLQVLQYIVDLQKLRFERVPPEKRSVEDWEKEHALFDRIGEQIFYMDKVVADLQDYARSMTLERERVQVSAIVHDVITSLPQTDHVQIVSEVSDLMVMADPHLMHRVFANLILNAIQAMPDGGT